MTQREIVARVYREVAQLIEFTEPGTIFGDDYEDLTAFEVITVDAILKEICGKLRSISKAVKKAEKEKENG